MSELPLEEKLKIVKRMVKAWIPRAEETFEQVFPPGDSVPEDLRKCNFHEFIARVFNNNPQSIRSMGIPNAEEYEEAVKFEMAGASEKVVG